jgi:hypothetical protein
MASTSNPVASSSSIHDVVCYLKTAYNLLTLVQPSSPESGHPRKRRRVGNPFVDLEAVADHNEEEEEEEEEHVEDEQEDEDPVGREIWALNL